MINLGFEHGFLGFLTFLSEITVVMMHDFKHKPLRRKGQVDLCKLEASLRYILVLKTNKETSYSAVLTIAWEN